MIPKVIHYCWLSDDPFPEKIQRCIDSWKKYLPDYELVHWNFERFPRGKSKWVDQAFDTHKYAFAADYIRLYALYHFGGIYLDSDVEVLKPLDEFLDLPYFIGKEPSETGVEAAVLGCEKGNLLIKEMLDSYEGREFIQPDGGYDDYPIPYKIRACIDSQYRYNPIERKEDFLYSEDVINIFPVDFFSPKDFNTLELKVTERTYTIHHFASSWVKPSSPAEKWRKKKGEFRRWVLKKLCWNDKVVLMSHSAIDSMFDVSFSRPHHSPLYNARLSQEDFLELLKLKDSWKDLKLKQVRRTDSKYKDRITSYYPILGIEGTAIEIHYTTGFSLEQILERWKETVEHLENKKIVKILATNDVSCAKDFLKIGSGRSLIITSDKEVLTLGHALLVDDLSACNEKSVGRNKLMLRLCRKLFWTF